MTHDIYKSNSQERYNFDQIFDRSGSNAIKTLPRVLETWFGSADLLPLWVADMDFQVPQPVIKALKKRMEHPIFGYTTIGNEYLESITSWFQRRHSWLVDSKWIRYSPGVVPAINFIIQRFTRPGDRIIIQPPVYYPFKDAIEENGRILLQNQLKYEENRYFINFDELEELCQIKRVKMFILCNPHNPVGRVWSREELLKMGEICMKNQVLVLADEIHCDLIMPGHTFIPFASLSSEFEQNSITCNAPSKTFNIAGMQVSNVIIPSSKLREMYINKQNLLALHGPTIFGAEALKAAYNHGEVWLNAVLKYIWNNYQYFKSELSTILPKASVLPLEGTYLVWVDFNPYQFSEQELEKRIKNDAKLALDAGTMFGLGGNGFQRFNIACPRSILEEVINRLKITFKDIQ